MLQSSNRLPLKKIDLNTYQRSQKGTSNSVPQKEFQLFTSPQGISSKKISDTPFGFQIQTKDEKGSSTLRQFSKSTIKKKEQNNSQTRCSTKEGSQSIQSTEDLASNYYQRIMKFNERQQSKDNHIQTASTRIKTQCSLENKDDHKRMKALRNHQIPIPQRISVDLSQIQNLCKSSQQQLPLENINQIFSKNEENQSAFRSTIIHEMQQTSEQSCNILSSQYQSYEFQQVNQSNINNLVNNFLLPSKGSRNSFQNECSPKYNSSQSYQNGTVLHHHPHTNLHTISESQHSENIEDSQASFQNYHQFNIPKTDKANSSQFHLPASIFQNEQDQLKQQKEAAELQSCRQVQRICLDIQDIISHQQPLFNLVPHQDNVIEQNSSEKNLNQFQRQHIKMHHEEEVHQNNLKIQSSQFNNESNLVDDSDVLFIPPQFKGNPSFNNSCQSILNMMENGQIMSNFKKRGSEDFLPLQQLNNNDYLIEPVKDSNLIFQPFFNSKEILKDVNQQKSTSQIVSSALTEQANQQTNQNDQIENQEELIFSQMDCNELPHTQFQEANNDDQFQYQRNLGTQQQNILGEGEIDFIELNLKLSKLPQISHNQEDKQNYQHERTNQGELDIFLTSSNPHSYYILPFEKEEEEYQQIPQQKQQEEDENYVRFLLKSKRDVNQKLVQRLLSIERRVYILQNQGRSQERGRVTTILRKSQEREEIQKMKLKFAGISKPKKKQESIFSKERVCFERSLSKEKMKVRQDGSRERKKQIGNQGKDEKYLLKLEKEVIINNQVKIQHQFDQKSSQYLHKRAMTEQTQSSRMDTLESNFNLKQEEQVQRELLLKIHDLELLEKSLSIGREKNQNIQTLYKN